MMLEVCSVAQAHNKLDHIYICSCCCGFTRLEMMQRSLQYARGTLLNADIVDRILSYLAEYIHEVRMAGQHRQQGNKK